MISIDIAYHGGCAGVRGGGKCRAATGHLPGQRPEPSTAAEGSGRVPGLGHEQHRMVLEETRLGVGLMSNSWESVCLRVWFSRSAATRKSGASSPPISMLASWVRLSWASGYLNSLESWAYTRTRSTSGQQSRRSASPSCGGLQRRSRRVSRKRIPRAGHVAHCRATISSSRDSVTDAGSGGMEASGRTPVLEWFCNL